MNAATKRGYKPPEILVGFTRIDDPDNPKIDHARRDDLVETMTRAMVHMSRKRILITVDNLANQFGFTRAQIEAAHTDAGVRAAKILGLYHGVEIAAHNSEFDDGL